MSKSFLKKKSTEIENIPLVDSAAAKAKQQVQNFWVLIHWQAKLLAYREKAERVLERHVDEAASYLLSPKLNHGWKEKLYKFVQEFLKIIGTGLGGGFISGVVNTLSSAEAEINLVELNTSIVAMGFIGVIMVFIGLLMEVWRK